MHSLDEMTPEGGPACCTPVARHDVRVRLVVALATILAVVVSTQVWFPLGVLLACLVMLLAARMPLLEVLHRLAGPLALAVLLCVLQGFMTGSTPAASIDLGPWRLTATREGLWAGALVGARVAGSVAVILVLCHATPAERIFAALRWARVPHTWIEIAMLMYRYTFTLLEQASSVLAAQRIRLGYAGWRRSMRSMGSLAGIVTLRSIDQAERTHEAMVARGYQGKLPVPCLPALTRREWAKVFLGLAIVAATYFLAQGCLP